MNPNPGSLPVKAAIIIWGLCCSNQINPYPAVGLIPLPAGYHRIAAKNGSFAAWLRNVPLKKDKTVRLYDGSVKSDQESQFAVLNISVGNKDLQQCADAIMRLRAEYLYSLKDIKDIEFRTAQGIRLNFGEWAAGQRWEIAGGRLVGYRVNGRARDSDAADSARIGYCDDRKCFWDYLQIVFAWCGTLTLEQQLKPLARTSLAPRGEMQIGDVFIRGGSPGHAMLVVDMAEDAAGRKICLLTQSYMPAQDIHIVKNLDDTSLSPWYSVDYDRPVVTPAWTFYPGQLRTWP